MKSDTPETDAVWSATAQIDGIESMRMMKMHAEEMERLRNHYRVKMYEMQIAVRNLEHVDKWGTVEEAHKRLFALLPENA